MVNLKKINVLVVEDNEDDFYFVKKALSDKKYVLQHIISGTEALSYLLNLAITPDIILLDNHLPGLDGIDILEKLIENKKEYPIIFLTTDKTIDTVVKAMKLGALDFLIKSPELKNDLPNKVDKIYTLYKHKLDKKELEKELFQKNKFLSENLKQTPLAVIYADTQMCISEWNLAAEKMFGYSKKEALGANLFELVVPRNLLPEIETVRQNVLNEISGNHYQNKNKTKSGYEIICNWFNAVIRDKNNKPIGFACLVEDITEKLQIESALADSEKRYSTIVDNLLMGIVVHVEGEILYVNDAILNMLGYTNEPSIVDKNLLDFVHPDDCNKISNLLKTNATEAVLKNASDKNSIFLEVRLIKQNGTYVTAEGSATSINYYGKPARMVMINNITERKQAEEKLQNKNIELNNLSNSLTKNNKLLIESRKQFKNLFEQSPISLWEEDFSDIKRLLDKKSTEVKNLKIYLDNNPDFVQECASAIKILNVNTASLMLLGVESKEALISHLTQNFNENSYSVFKNILLAIASNKKSFESETEYIINKGDIITTILKITVLDNDWKVVLSLSDITSLKRIENELTTAKKATEESEKKYKLLYDSNPMPMSIFDTETLNFLSVNDSFIDKYGYTRDEFLNMTILDIRPESEIEKLKQSVNLIDKGVTNAGVFLHKKKNEEIIQVKIIRYEIVFNNKIAKLVLINDVTGKIKAEKKLIESEKKFRGLYEKSGDAILIIENGVFVDCNKATVKMLNYSSKTEFLNMHPSKLSPKLQPDGRMSHEKSEEMMALSLNKGTHRFEWLHTKSNGEMFSVEVLLTAISNEPNNKIIHCVWRDITDRKIAENKLNDTHLFLINTLENITDGYVSLNKDWNYTYVNKKAGEMFGRDPLSLVGKNIWEEFPEGVNQSFYKNYYKAVKTQKTVLIEEYYEPWNQWYENKIVPSKEGLAIFFQNITSRKLAEQALKNSEYLLRKSQEVATIGSYSLDFSNNLWESSAVLNSIFGLNKETEKELTEWVQVIHPEDRVMMQEYLAVNIMTNHEIFDKEYRIVRIDNQQERWVHGMGELEFSTKGELLKMIGTIQDITKQKQTETVLRENERQLKEAQEIAQLGHFVYDDNTEMYETSAILNTIVGLDKNYKIDKQKWIGIMHPDDTENVQNIFNSKEHKNISIEFRLNRPSDNKTIWILVNAKKRWDRKNKRIRMAGTLQDITERKLSEEKIKQSDIILKQIDSLIQVVDVNGNITYASPSVENILGYKPEEVLGQGWWQLTTSNTKEANYVRDAILNNMYKKTPLPKNLIDRKIKAKNGIEKIFQWENSKGINNSLIFIGLDVTERRREEKTKEIIFNITKKANEAVPLDVLFNFIKSELGKLINTTNFFIALYNETTEMIKTPYMVDEQDSNDDFPKGKTLTGYVIDTKKVLLANETVFKKLERAKKIERQGPSSKCWLGVPLLVNNEAIGAIVIQSYDNKKAYTDKDVALLELIASNISQVIKQSRDFEKINLLNQALTQSPEAIIITNLKGEIEYVNPAFTLLSGYTPKEVIGNTPRILKSGEQSNNNYKNLWKTISGGFSWNSELINKRKDGTHYLINANISPVKNKDGKITHYIGIHEDITEKRKLERDFIHAFIDAQEQEKQSFGEDLHDGISQILAAEAMYIDVLMRLDKKDDKKITDFLAKIRALNLSATNDARNIAHGLMSKQLKEEGLLKAVNHICIDLSNTRDISFSFKHKGLKESDFNKDIKTNIFRIIQEVSTNTIRHSLAKNAFIELTRVNKNSLKLVIKDDGVGIDFDKIKRENKGAGLKNIERRVTLLRGKLSLDSVPDKGTCYTIIVPLHSVK